MHVIKYPEVLHRQNTHCGQHGHYSESAAILLTSQPVHRSCRSCASRQVNLKISAKFFDEQNFSNFKIFFQLRQKQGVGNIKYIYVAWPYNFHMKILGVINILYNEIQVFVFHGATAPSGPGPLRYPGFTITFRHTHTLGRTPLDE